MLTAHHRSPRMVRPWAARAVIALLNHRRSNLLGAQFLQSAANCFEIVGGARSGHSIAPTPCRPYRGGRLRSGDLSAFCRPLSLRNITYGPFRRGYRIVESPGRRCEYPGSPVAAALLWRTICPQIQLI